MGDRFDKNKLSQDDRLILTSLNKVIGILEDTRDSCKNSEIESASTIMIDYYKNEVRKIKDK